MRCQARIVRTFKTKKAECRWPECTSGLLPDNLKYPQCDGVVTATVHIESDPFYGGVDHVLDIELTCTMCRHPFVRGFQELLHSTRMTGKLDVTRLLEVCE